MHEKMKKLNLLSAAAFSVSSLSLLSIPFIDIGDELPVSAYAIAAIFWIGLLTGAGIQVYLSHECKKMKLHSEFKTHRIPLMISAAAFVILMVLIVSRSQSEIAVMFSLFATVVSLQSTVIIKRKGCLR